MAELGESLKGGSNGLFKRQERQAAQGAVEGEGVPHLFSSSIHHL
jgi:hypothetical protein